MSRLKWNDGFMSSISHFDAHHKQLVSQLNKIHDALEAHPPASSIKVVIDELLDSSTRQFAKEEHWMRSVSYPMLSEHTAEHKLFVHRVAQMHDDFSRMNGNFPLEILTFLKNWLFSHFLKADIGCCIFFATTRDSSRK